MSVARTEAEFIKTTIGEFRKYEYDLVDKFVFRRLRNPLVINFSAPDIISTYSVTAVATHWTRGVKSTVD